MGTRYPFRCLLLPMAILCCGITARAQGGPPLLTNDPIPPEHDNWEINLGTIPEITNTTTSVQLIQIDLN